jgi:hypothetical protein
MKKNFLLCSLSLLLASNLYADRLTSTTFKISQIKADGNGPMAIIPAVSSAGCAYFSIWSASPVGNTVEGYNLQTSTAMSAFMAGKTVQVEYDDASVACYIYNIRVNAK